MGRADAETARLFRPDTCDEEVALAARTVSRGDECGSAVGTSSVDDRATRSKSQPGGKSPSDAAGDDDAVLPYPFAHHDVEPITKLRKSAQGLCMCPFPLAMHPYTSYPVQRPLIVSP